jgi:dTDP-glucose 4,6-dehydratase
MKKDKIILFGSNSFAGRSFIKYALDYGYHVTATSRSNEIKEEFRIYRSLTNNENYKYIKFDINNNSQRNKIFKYINKYKIGNIVDFSSQSMVAESWENPEHWVNTNCLGKLKLIKSLLNIKHSIKFIRISTPEVYGNNNRSILEDDKFSPSTPYAVTQATADNFFNIYAKFKKLNAVNLKFANFYGPGQQLYRIIPKTIMYILLKKKLEIHGNGSSIRSFILPKDFCSSIIKALKFGKRGETYNISSRETISIKNLVKKICKKMNYPFNKLVYFSNDRLAKDQKYLLNSKKSLKYLNWKNLTSLNDGLDETIKWYKKNILKLKFNSFKYNHKK